MVSHDNVKHFKTTCTIIMHRRHGIFADVTKVVHVYHHNGPLCLKIGSVQLGITFVLNAFLNSARSPSPPVGSQGTRNFSLEMARVVIHSLYFRDPI